MLSGVGLVCMGIGVTYEEACPVRRVRPEEAFRTEGEGVDLVDLRRGLLAC